MLRLSADQRVMVAQPFLAVLADAYVNATERTDQPNRIGAVFQHMGNQHLPLLAGKIQRSSGDLFLMRYGHASRNGINRVDCSRDYSDCRWR